jgi:hypothetical protein
MQLWIKRTAVYLCLVTSLAVPSVVAAESPVTGMHLISAPIAAIEFHQAPSAVTVNGKTVTFDQGAVMLDDVLMVPVRAVAEAAGAEVTWAGEIQMVHVQMPGRTVLIRLGQIEAQMHEQGVTYPDRNRIAMTKAPVILNGRTLVAFDALTGIFGFQAQAGQDGLLQLTFPTEGTKAGFPQQPAEKVEVSLETEQNNQRQVDEGHSPYQVSAIMVANAFILSREIPTDMDAFNLAYDTVTHAVVDIPTGPISKVYLQRLIRQDEAGIWTVVGYDKR